MSTLVGTLLNGRYRLDAQIGAGGMSYVYRAFDTTLERQVAIKLMHREIASDSDQLERFRREARAVAQLSHPHIVTVIDAGESGAEDDPVGRGRPFIVFEYVEGETLKDRIRRHGQLPIAEALAYAIEVARALGAAHSRNIVHRDVKPQNVLVDEEGSAKVTDFGIARSLDEDGLTAEGRVLGTTDYVSPEQALGHQVTGQSDLYSLGIVLYEMLTGEVPFSGENQVAVAMKHVREQIPDVQVRRPGVSASLAAVVDAATAKDLGHRYADAAEMIRDLEEVLAMETARTGQATGEATTVLRTLPASARRRLPLRMRSPVWLAVALLAIGAGAIALAIGAAGTAERGTGSGAEPEPRGFQAVSLKAKAATDYDPLGTGGEHPQDADFVLDRTPSTTWSTENYRDGEFGKAGVGLYVDADPGVAARRIEVRSPTPGYGMTVYGARSGPPQAIDDPAWVELGRIGEASGGQELDLAARGTEFRYYLVWLTSLPPGAQSVEISEIRLLR